MQGGQGGFARLTFNTEERSFPSGWSQQVYSGYNCGLYCTVLFYHYHLFYFVIVLYFITHL